MPELNGRHQREPSSNPISAYVVSPLHHLLLLVVQLGLSSRLFVVLTQTLLPIHLQVLPHQPLLLKLSSNNLLVHRLLKYRGCLCQVFGRSVVSSVVDASFSLTVDHSMAHFQPQQTPSASSCTSTPVSGLGAPNCPRRSLFDGDGLLSAPDISSDSESEDSDFFL